MSSLLEKELAHAAELIRSLDTTTLDHPASMSEALALLDTCIACTGTEQTEVEELEWIVNALHAAAEAAEMRDALQVEQALSLAGARAHRLLDRVSRQTA